MPIANLNTRPRRPISDIVARCSSDFSGGWAIPGWVVLAFSITVEVLDWWNRIEFFRAKVIEVNPSLQPVFEWLVSGQGRLCIMLLGFILLFLAARRKEQHEDVSHQAPAVGPPIAPPSPVPTVQVLAPPTIADSRQEVKLPPNYSNREIVDATPDYLMDLFDQHTSIQAQRLIEPYIGKWMIVSGKLRDIADHPHGSQLTFESSAPDRYGVVFMWFHQPDRRDRLSVLRRGTELTVLGQIQWVNKVEVNLQKCELI